MKKTGNSPARTAPAHEEPTISNRRARKTVVIPNRAESPVRNLLFAAGESQ
jgi:hypothetical protein